MKSVFNSLKELPPRLRLLLSFGLAGLVFFLVPTKLLEVRLLASWNSGLLCFLSMVLLMMSYATPERTRIRSQRWESHNWAIFSLVVVADFISILAIGFLLATDHKMPQSVIALHLILSVVAIFGSWFLTNTMFAKLYASLYYRDKSLNSAGEPAPALAVPDEDQPDFLDFMYFSFTIGMTSQTSDVFINSPVLRRVSLGQAWVSFFFFIVILAATVNITSGLI
jgi:uncharacterized membrane protein